MPEDNENSAKKFLHELSNCLEKNQLKEALELFRNPSHEDILANSSFDIVPFICSHLTAENEKCNKGLIECCQALLNVIVEKNNPSETVLELLEQIEHLEDDVKFCVILNQLGKCLNRMPDKTKVIEWCMSTIRSYIEDLPVPEDNKCEIMETDEKHDIEESMKRIMNVYGAVISFLQPLVEEAALKNDSSGKHILLRLYLSSGLISLLGKPLCHIPENECKLADIKQNIPEEIILLVSNITGDSLQFLNVINKRIKKGTQRRTGSTIEEVSNLEVTLFESEESLPSLAYANFYYYTLTKPFLWERTPQIYHPQFILEACIYLVNVLLQEQKSNATKKGLNLIDQVLRRVRKYSLTPDVLELKVYSDLISALSNVMIYHDKHKERKKALTVFRNYIQIFNMQARYFIVTQLYKISEHSGLLSLTTSIFKNSVIECLQTVPPSPYFLGSNLEALVKKACKLPHGSASDLVELSDEVITSLNLLRFLFIRDQHNQTGIWNIADTLENEYLKPLREGIALCKSHWQVKIKDLEEQKKSNTTMYDNVELEKSDAEITLTVGGEKLPVMPITEKISFCYQAVNGLDVMESILIRVNECIVNNPFKHKCAQ